MTSSPDEPEQRSFFDRRYRSSFDQQLHQEYRFYGAYLRFVEKRHARLPGSGARALDVGFGAGGVLRLFQDRGYEVCGLEVSEVAVAEAGRRGLGKVSTGNIEDGIPFGQDFQLVTALEVLEHLYRPEQALRNIRAGLAPGGLFIATSPAPGTTSHPTDVSVKAPDEWCALMRAAGFSRAIAEPVRYLPMLWRVHPQLNRLLTVPVRFSHTVLYVCRA